MSGRTDVEIAGQLERQAADENARCQRTCVSAIELAAEIDDVRHEETDPVAVNLDDGIVVYLFMAAEASYDFRGAI